MRREKRDKLFGTDGIRSKFGKFPLSEESIPLIAKSAEQLFNPSKILIGMDTRSSGNKILSLFNRGLSSETQLFNAGIITTPGISYLTAKEDFDMGVMISASHNPSEYNGIKFFSSKGEKISPEEENKLEKIFFTSPESEIAEKRIEKYSGNDKYIDFLKYIASGITSCNYKIFIDCANGSTSSIAPEVFKEICSSIGYMGNLPDGTNINEKCGSTFPEAVSKKVISSSYDIGISFDGDGDRVVITDSMGRVINGDHILLILAEFFSGKSPDFPKKIIGTVMSNIALEMRLKESGIKLYRSNVGDRNVFNMMQQKGALLGGEPSGHIISSTHCNSGDGILTALLFLKAMDFLSIGPNEIYEYFRSFPQKTLSIPVKEKRDLESWKRLSEMMESFNRKFGNNSRIVIRYSGTEPVIRLMVESQKKEIVEQNIKKFGDFIRTEIGGES